MSSLGRLGVALPYVFNIAVPAGTYPEDPLVQNVVIEGDVIEKLRVRIPPGHLGLTGLQIWFGERQLVPENPRTWLSGDDEVIEFEWNLPLHSKAATLTIKAHNYDTVYDHVFIVTIITRSYAYGPVVELLNEIKQLLEDVRHYLQDLAGYGPEEVGS